MTDQGKHTEPGLFLVQILLEPLVVAQRFQKPQGPLRGQMSGDVVKNSQPVPMSQTLYITRWNMQASAVGTN